MHYVGLARSGYLVIPAGCYLSLSLYPPFFSYFFILIFFGEKMRELYIFLAFLPPYSGYILVNNEKNKAKKFFFICEVRYSPNISQGSSKGGFITSTLSRVPT